MWFQALTALRIKMAVCWDVALRGPVEIRAISLMMEVLRVFETSACLYQIRRRNTGTFLLSVSRVAQAVQCWLQAGRPGDPWQRRKDFFCSLCPDRFGAHSASCTMSTGVLSLGVKNGRGVTLTTHPHLVPRSRMSRSYTCSPAQEPLT
jgi:hypothetical protein